jgi:porphobilinogen synthase
MSQFPAIRLRRLRKTAGIRKLLDFEMPSIQKFIWPVFVVPGKGIIEPIATMPGQSRYSPDELCKALYPLVKAGLGGIMIFGIPGHGKKDHHGSGASDPHGIVPEAIRAIRSQYPDLTIFADVCLCAYTTHGHCGPLDDLGGVHNDKALKSLAEAAICYVDAGADGVAPSAMMDGQVATIRDCLDKNNLTDTLIMSYSTKFASSMYGPFRDAEKSTPSKGDRTAYQTSYANLSLALRESELDIREGADILMVKPALFYLDVLAKLRDSTKLPIAAYNVSGEYAMLSLMAQNGIGDLNAMVRESVTSIFRAGADILISYWANQYEAIFSEGKD